jgi:hypothetical protein
VKSWLHYPTTHQQLALPGHMTHQDTSIDRTKWEHGKERTNKGGGIVKGGWVTQVDYYWLLRCIFFRNPSKKGERARWPLMVGLHPGLPQRFLATQESDTLIAQGSILCCKKRRGKGREFSSGILHKKKEKNGVASWWECSRSHLAALQQRLLATHTWATLIAQGSMQRRKNEWAVWRNS